MQPIHYIERTTNERKEEKVYGSFFVHLLYGKYPFSGLISRALIAISRFPLVSVLYGKIQHSRLSKRKVKPFIKKYKINMLESQKSADQFQSFNDFFIRKLKPDARAIDPAAEKAIIPADGRYIFIPNISTEDGFYVKGKKFSLDTFLQDKMLYERYKDGLMIIARLCPVDYHRFHFPCTCIPQKARLINGPLNSVNLLSLKHNIHVFSENKRMTTILNTEHFGQVVFSEIGAVCVGGIHQTYTPLEKIPKGQEKGYFSFGGSSLILLFEKGRLELAPDLKKFPKYTEVRCQFGQILGHAL